MSEPAVQINLPLWIQALAKTQLLSEDINLYVRSYVNAYETLSESFMSVSSEEHLRLLRQGSEEQMREEANAFYERIQTNADAFGRLFENIFLLVSRVREERVPTSGHELFLRLAMELSEGYRTRIEQLRTQIELIRNEILERERYFGMISVYRPPRAYPPVVGNWFPITNDTETTYIDWYRYAHHRLLKALLTELTKIDSVMQSLEDRNQKMYEFCTQNIDRLKQQIPDFNYKLANVSVIGMELSDLLKDWNELHEKYLSARDEQYWRSSLKALRTAFPRTLIALEKGQIQLLTEFEIWKTEYLASHEIELEDLCRQFEELFYRKT